MASEEVLQEEYRILQVEDNPGDVRLIQLFADSDPHTQMSFVQVDNLAAAKEIVEQESIDLVLLDLNLPDSQGLATLIEFMDWNAEVPVIVLTGLDDQRLAMKAVKLGAQDYLIKGVNLENNLSRAVRYATERHQLYMVQRELALRDELTGLYNRRGLQMLAEQQFRLAERRQEQLSLLLADIDGMKEINDQFGHPMGDEALRDVARVMKLTFRTSDVLARIGGDEFVVLALDTDRQAERRMIERWQNELTSYSSGSGSDRPFKLNLSIGIITRGPDDQLELEAMIDAADKKMYRMKKGSLVERETMNNQ